MSKLLALYEGRNYQVLALHDGNIFRWIWGFKQMCILKTFLLFESHPCGCQDSIVVSLVLSALLHLDLSELSLLFVGCFAAESNSLRVKQHNGGRRIKLLYMRSTRLKAIATLHDQMKSQFYFTFIGVLLPTTTNSPWVMSAIARKLTQWMKNLLLL